MSGISSKAAGSLENNKKYNGIEFDNTFDLNFYDALYRELDPQLGRWWEIDPKVANFYNWSPYNSNFNDPIRFADPLGDNPILKALAKKGIKWATKTVKNAFKPISREQALELLQKGKSVFSTTENSAKNAKTLMKEAADGKKVVRHDGHQLENGKIGLDHFQKKAGDGSHVFYNAFILVASKVPEDIINGPGGALVTELGKLTGLNNVGKNLLGNNKIGSFIDNWINPFN